MPTALRISGLPLTSLSLGKEPFFRIQNMMFAIWKAAMVVLRRINRDIAQSQVFISLVEEATDLTSNIPTDFQADPEPAPAHPDAHPGHDPAEAVRLQNMALAISRRKPNLRMPRAPALRIPLPVISVIEVTAQLAPVVGDGSGSSDDSDSNPRWIALAERSQIDSDNERQHMTDTYLVRPP